MTIKENTCVVVGCASPIWIRKRRLCKLHYGRWYHSGRPSETYSLDLPAIACERCGKQFQPRSRRQKYCGAGCNTKRFRCSSCDKPVWRSSTSGTEVVCRECRSAAQIQYRSAHARVTRFRGRARDHQCARCGEQAENWAYDHEDPEELTEYLPDEKRRGWRSYSANPDNYLPLCRPCHHKFDVAHIERKLPELRVDLFKRPIAEWSDQELALGHAALGRLIQIRRAEGDRI